MAILQATLVSTFYNQQCINRWTYVSGGTPAAASLSFGLAYALGAVYDVVAVPPAYPGGTIINTLANILSDQVDFQQLTVINPYDPEDFYQTPFVPANGGTATGEALSPAMAYGFRSNQVRRDVARATKRFPGVLEANVNGGGVMNGLVTANLATLATRMSAVLSYDDEGNTVTFSPAVAGLQEYDPNPDTPTANHRAYRWYPTEAAQLAKMAVGIVWQPYDTVRTQVSRQYGHGR